MTDVEERPPERQDSVARASLFIVFAKAGGNAGYFLAVVVLAHALGRADRGAYAFITTTALVASIIAGSGLREAYTVFLAQRPADRPRLTANLLLFAPASGIVGAAVVAAVLAALPGIRPERIGPTEIAIIAAAIFATAMLHGGYALTLGLAQFRMQAFIQPAYIWSFGITLAIVWRVAGLTVASAAILWLSFQLLGALMLYAVSLPLSGIGRPSVPLLREAWRFGIRAWVGALSTYLGFRSDQVLMGFISTESQLGIYAVAVNGSEVPLYVPQSVSNTLLPIIAGSTEGSREERTLRVYRIVTILTTAVAAVGMAAGPFLIPLVFGHDFAPSVTPFLCLMPGAVGFVASSIFSTALAASSRPGLSSVGPFATLVVNFALDLALIPPYGATGAAIASSAGFFVGGLAAVVAFRSQFDLRWRALLPQREDAAAFAGIARRLRR